MIAGRGAPPEGAIIWRMGTNGKMRATEHPSVSLIAAQPDSVDRRSADHGHGGHGRPRDGVAGWADVFQAWGQSAPPYTDPALSTGTPIRAVHIDELRQLVIVLGQRG